MTADLYDMTLLFATASTCLAGVSTGAAGAARTFCEVLGATSWNAAVASKSSSSTSTWAAAAGSTAADARRPCLLGVAGATDAKASSASKSSSTGWAEDRLDFGTSTSTRTAFVPVEERRVVFFSAVLGAMLENAALASKASTSLAFPGVAALAEAAEDRLDLGAST